MSELTGKANTATTTTTTTEPLGPEMVPPRLIAEDFLLQLDILGLTPGEQVDVAAWLVALVTRRARASGELVDAIALRAKGHRHELAPGMP